MEATLITHRSHPLSYYLRPHLIPLMFWRHGMLIRQLIGRAVAARYRGSLLGVLWSLIIPLVLLAVYTFVFSVVFQARWQAARGPGEAGHATGTPAATGSATLSAAPAEQSRPPSKVEFALTLFCGLLLFNVFSETLANSTGVVVNHTSYVKKLVFPLEVLPAVMLGAALVNGGISLAVLLVAQGVFIGWPDASVAYYPLVVLPLLMLCLGLGWFVASLGVYVRDIGPITTVILQMLVFLTPVFYSLEQVPEQFRAVMRLNPLSVIVENARYTLMWKQDPDWLWLGLVTLLAALIMQLGYVWFMKTKRGFSDVL